MIEEFGFSQADIATALSKKQSTISNKLRLLRLPLAAQVIITANGLTERHARELLRIGNTTALYDTLDYIIVKKLNVPQTVEYINNLLAPNHRLQLKSARWVK